MKCDYDLIIIGAGTAGVVAAVYGKAMYRKVLLVESGRPGGKNFFSYTYPLNAVISISRKINTVRSMENLGVNPGAINMDFNILKRKTEDTMKLIAEGVSSEIFRKMGIDFISGSASFKARNVLDIDGKSISGSKFILSTGLENIIPDIQGLDKDKCLFAEDVINLSELPESACIIGAGESGIEISNALAGFGSRVILFERNSEILPDEDSEIRDILEKNMTEKGITIYKSAVITKIESSGNGYKVNYVSEGKETSLETDKIFCCAGRRPDFGKLNPDAAGIRHVSDKIITDRYLRTSSENIFAAGDITGKMNYNNTAEIEGLTAVINSAHYFKKPVNYDIIPRCINGDMEFARFGLTESEAEKKYGHGIRVYKFPLKYSIKASIENMSEGMAKIICRSNSRIVGAHIYSDGASELIHQLLLLVRLKRKFSEISHIPHAFPSYSDILRQPSKRCYMEQQIDNPLLNIINGLFGRKLR
ncbi:MAG: NAD(P)/FAD-dependent oxidoreductase [Spirochaetes bacterium]|nr:NAD(P)/FAD-dependent oxidoreductase [Spirochaetota bacterium]